MGTAMKRSAAADTAEASNAGWAGDAAHRDSRPNKGSSVTKTAGTDGDAATATCYDTKGSVLTEQTAAEEGSAKKVPKRSSHSGVARPEGPSPSCPRCHAGPQSTKFAFYNNKDIKQPRYYCKECQRYWTVGGVLRNVPPGSGRRKSRSAASREGRRTASNVGNAPESAVGSNEATLPDNLINSNPLASVLMSNLGLNAGDRASMQPLLQPHVPAESQSVDLSNQTTDTTQRLQGMMPLLSPGAAGTTGVHAAAPVLPVFTGAFPQLASPLVQPAAAAAVPPAGGSAFTQHRADGGGTSASGAGVQSGQPLLAAVAVKTEAAKAQEKADAAKPAAQSEQHQQQSQTQPQAQPQTSQQGAHGSALNSPCAAPTSPMPPFAPSADGTGYFLSLMQQQQQQQQQQYQTQAPQPVGMGPSASAFAGMPANGAAPTYGVPAAQMAPNNMLASMANMPPAMQMLIAQNAAWLFSHSQSQQVAGGAGAAFPGMGVAPLNTSQYPPAAAIPTYGGADGQAGFADGTQPKLNSGLPSAPSVTSIDKHAPLDTCVPPIAPLRTAPVAATEPASASAPQNPWLNLQATATALPPSYLWAQPKGAFGPCAQAGYGAAMPGLQPDLSAGAAPDSLAQAQTLQALPNQMQFPVNPGQQNGGAGQ